MNDAVTCNIEAELTLALYSKSLNPTHDVA